MKKRTLTLILTAALGLASAQSADASTPDTRLNSASVTVEMGQYSGPLSSLLAAVAKAAGYAIVFDTNVDNLPGASATSGASAAPTTYDLVNKPFNQVWPLLMDVYGLSYQITTLGNQQVLRISNSPIQAVIPLKNASAADAVTNVKLFFGTPVYNDNQIKDASGNVVSTTHTLSDVKLDSPTLRIIADPRTNSLIVRGTNREIADVQRVVAQIDTPVSGTSATSDGGSVQSVYTVKSNAADISALLASQYPNLRVVPVGGSRTLVITGSQAQITAATALLAQVDQPVVSGSAIVQKVFSLNNARASDVKKTLDGTLQQALTPTTTVSQPATTTTTTPTSTSSTTTTQQVPVVPTQATGDTGTSNGATVIADDRTNTLIVRGTQDQVDQVAALIPQLDQKVPLINVQVRIQEITQTGSRALGLDWNVGFGNFVAKLVSGSLTGLFNATQSLAGFNIGATLNALESQGLTKRIYDGSVTMQSGQRANGSNGATENATAGAAATLKSGGRIELNIPGTGGSPAIQKQIDYGVTLNFNNPQVASDGTIAINLDALINQPNSPITTSSNFQSLDFANREAQTTVNLKSGQTVMLGGLLSTNQTTSTSGVPFLSSIPIIGNLFKTTTTSNEQSQLLIVLTANVVN